MAPPVFKTGSRTVLSTEMGFHDVGVTSGGHPMGRRWIGIVATRIEASLRTSLPHSIKSIKNIIIVKCRVLKHRQHDPFGRVEQANLYTIPSTTTDGLEPAAITIIVQCRRVEYRQNCALMPDLTPNRQENAN